MAGVFELKTAGDLLAKLGRELERLRAAPNNVDHAYNFFVTAEHMLDWLHPGNAGKTQRETTRNGEILLQLVSHLASGAKHFDQLLSHHQSVRSSGLRSRIPNPMLRRIFPDVLGVALASDAVTSLGTWIMAIDLANRVHTYWSAPGRVKSSCPRGARMRSAIAKVPALVAQLRSIVAELGHRFPGRHFTLDGRLVGSLGEVLAAHHYGLELLPPGAKQHDDRARDGRRVQIKATQIERVALYAEPEHLLVLKLETDGSFAEIYNGPGRPAWRAAGRQQKNGQRSVNTRKLQRLMGGVSRERRLPRRTVGRSTRASSEPVSVLANNCTSETCKEHAITT